jgi:hypothetical protein
MALQHPCRLWQVALSSGNPAASATTPGCGPRHAGFRNPRPPARRLSRRRRRRPAGGNPLPNSSPRPIAPYPATQRRWRDQCRTRQGAPACHGYPAAGRPARTAGAQPPRRSRRRIQGWKSPASGRPPARETTRRHAPIRPGPWLGQKRAASSSGSRRIGRKRKVMKHSFEGAQHCRPRPGLQARAPFTFPWSPCRKRPSIDC